MTDPTTLAAHPRLAPAALGRGEFLDLWLRTQDAYPAARGSDDRRKLLHSVLDASVERLLAADWRPLPLDMVSIVGWFTRRPVEKVGPHGEGKSAREKALAATLGFNVARLNCSTLQKDQFAQPVIRKRDGSYVMTQTVSRVFLPDQPTIMILEELPTADEELIPTLLEPLSLGTIGGIKISDHIRGFSLLGNPGDSGDYLAKSIVEAAYNDRVIRVHPTDTDTGIADWQRRHFATLDAEDGLTRVRAVDHFEARMAHWDELLAAGKVATEINGRPRNPYRVWSWRGLHRYLDNAPLGLQADRMLPVVFGERLTFARREDAGDIVDETANELKALADAAGTTHTATTRPIDDIVTAIAHGRVLRIEGPPGGGKSNLAEWTVLTLAALAAGYPPPDVVPNYLVDTVRGTVPEDVIARWDGVVYTYVSAPQTYSGKYIQMAPTSTGEIVTVVAEELTRRSFVTFDEWLKMMDTDAAPLLGLTEERELGWQPLPEIVGIALVGNPGSDHVMASPIDTMEVATRMDLTVTLDPHSLESRRYLTEFYGTVGERAFTDYWQLPDTPKTTMSMRTLGKTLDLLLAGQELAAVAARHDLDFTDDPHVPGFADASPLKLEYAIPCYGSDATSRAEHNLHDLKRVLLDLDVVSLPWLLANAEETIDRLNDPTIPAFHGEVVRVLLDPAVAVDQLADPSGQTYASGTPKPHPTLVDILAHLDQAHMPNFRNIDESRWPDKKRFFWKLATEVGSRRRAQVAETEAS